MAKRRGGYRGDQTHVVKFRASKALFEELRDLSANDSAALALTARTLIQKALEDKAIGRLKIFRK